MSLLKSCVSSWNTMDTQGLIIDSQQLDQLWVINLQAPQNESFQKLQDTLVKCKRVIQSAAKMEFNKTFPSK